MADFGADDLRESTFERTDLAESRLWAVDLSGSRLRGVDLSRAVMRGVELTGARIDGEVDDLVINGVEVGPLIEAELDRRDPRRAAMRLSDPAGFRATRRAGRDRSLPVRECLLVVPNEEWQHRRYAERDVAALAGS